MFNLVVECCDKTFANKCEFNEKGHDNKISRLSAIFLIDKTQFKFKIQCFLRIQISTLSQEK